MQPTLIRLRRLALLDMRVLDEVRTDPRATIPSLVVLAASVALLGLGGWLWWIASGLGDAGRVFVNTVLLGTLFSLAFWLVWLLVTYVLLQRLANVTVQVDQLVRTAGLAAIPLAIAPLMVIPAISFGVGLLALAGWVLVTQVAIERVSGVRGGAVTLANASGFGAWAIAMSLLATRSNQIAPGPFLAESIWDAVTGGGIFG